MKQITLDIANSGFQAFLEYLKAHKDKYAISNINVEETAENEQKILDGIKNAVKEIKLIKQGKIKPQSFEDLLDEL